MIQTSNLTEVELKAKVREWIIVVSGCCFYSRRFKMAGKMTSDMEELVFLANAIRETRRRHLNMQLLLRNLVARRRQVLNVALLLLLLVSQRNNTTVPRSIRSCRRLNRNTGWWDKAWNTYSEARFKKTFRVSRSTFNFILNRIEPFITKETVTEEPISAELRLALCLYRLGRGDYLYTIAEMSGLGVSTACSIVHEVCQVLVNHLWDESVSSHMPKTRKDFKKKILDMEEFWQFPCCWAAIDGCHIPLKCPPGGLEACKEYHNFKNFYSIVLMGMVDSRYRFVWGSCGYPGNFHDTVIFRSTDLELHSRWFHSINWETCGRCYCPATYSGRLCIPPTNMANETIHKCCFNTPAALLHLPSEQGSHGYRGCLWPTEG